MIIYKATFPNGKVYIGKTKNFNHRKRCHIYCARSGKNENKKGLISSRKFKYSLFFFILPIFGFLLCNLQYGSLNSSFTGCC